MRLTKIRGALFEGRTTAIPLHVSAEAYEEVITVEGGIADLVAALESTTWSSGCWCSGKDKRGHSATCEGRRAALRRFGVTPPGKEM